LPVVQKLVGAGVNTTARYDRSDEDAKRKPEETLHTPFAALRSGVRTSDYLPLRIHPSRLASERPYPNILNGQHFEPMRSLRASHSVAVVN
jgi:hypothetical protein